MMALRSDKGSLSDYSKRVEQLADQLKRSWIKEGISSNKANEMVIDKTIQLCQANASSVFVKSTLESTKFDTPKDVVAKYITSSQKQTNENKVLFNNARPMNFSNRGGQTRHFNHNRGNFNGNFNRNFNPNNVGFNRNTYRNNNSNYRPNNYNSNNPNSNNFRGNSRGNYHNNNNSFQNRRGNFNRNTNARTYAYQGNEQSPPSGNSTTQNWRRADEIQNED